MEGVKPCWMNGHLDAAGNVSWFAIAGYWHDDTHAVVRQVIDVRGRVATVEGGVEFPIADDEPAEWVVGGLPMVHSGEGQISCGGGLPTSVEEWWTSDGPNRALVDVSTGEIVFISCPLLS